MRQYSARFRILQIGKCFRPGGKSGAMAVSFTGNTMWLRISVQACGLYIQAEVLEHINEIRTGCKIIPMTFMFDLL